MSKARRAIRRPIGADTQLLALNGFQVAVRVQGEGDPLLLMNGMTRPLQTWDPFTAELSGRTVVSFDAPGVGASPTPMLPLSIPKLAALAVAVLDAVGIEDTDVLGFSHGGAVAQQLAAVVPGRVRRLVLVSTSCGAGATPSRRRAAVRALGVPGGVDAFLLGDAVGMLWQSLAISSWSSIPFLGGIRAPTLVVCGAHDRVVPPANSQVLAGRIPGASLVLLPGGHNLQRPDNAHELARVVEGFLPVRRGTQLRPTSRLTGADA